MKRIGDLSVVHVVPALFGPDGGIYGGAERYAFELARHLAEVTPTTLISFGDKASQSLCGRLKVRVLGKPWYVRGQRSNPFALSLLREAIKADVVHCHQQHVLASSLTALTCRLTGRRVFVSELGGGGWDISAYVSTDRWYHGHLHISQYSRKLFGHLDKPRARVIYGGVDIEKFSPDAATPRGDMVVFVGRLLPHKGVNYLVEAVDPEMRLELIGQAYDGKFLQELQSLAIGKNVVFRHDCGDGDLVEAYRKALCVVLPSVYTTVHGQHSLLPELLGQTLIEGMACGAPAICTDVASMPEVVEDGVTGFLVPPNDPAALGEKLRWLRSHPHEAAAMGRAARQRVLDKFTWPAVVERCLEAYRA